MTVSGGDTHLNRANSRMAPTASGSKTQGQRGAQHTISHFFSSGSAAGGTSGKRARSPVDLTLDSDEDLQPPAKRVKSKGMTAIQSSAAQAPNRELHIMSQYSYGSVDDSAGKTLTPEDAAANRQQEARRKLVRETLKQTMQPNGRDVQARSSSVADEAEHTQSDTEEQSDRSSPITSLFKDFESNLSVNTRGSKGKKGKTIEVGPSGNPYTPLELQVLQLKEENPGTLLMFEVGYKYWCVEHLHCFHCLMASSVSTEKMLGLHLRLLE
jgi:DNA mismatch repair protein MSH3